MPFDHRVLDRAWELVERQHDPEAGFQSTARLLHDRALVGSRWKVVTSGMAGILRHADDGRVEPERRPYHETTALSRPGSSEQRLTMT